MLKRLRNVLILLLTCAAMAMPGCIDVDDEDVRLDEPATVEVEQA